MGEKDMDARLFKKAISELCTRKDYPLHLAELCTRKDCPLHLAELCTPLHLAELCTRKDYPLHLAARYGQEDLVREMLSENRELALKLNSLGQSPLHLASARGHVEVVREILKADPGGCFVRDRNGMIPLHVAAIKGRVKVLKPLVKANEATVFLLTESGESILHLCAKNNKFEALMVLVELVNDPNFVNLRDEDDNTVLHLLAAKENSEVIRFLLGKKNTDLNAVNMDGNTPLDVTVINTSRLGFVGWKTYFLLASAGAKTTFKLTATRLDGNYGSWFFEAMLVLATLMVSVSFQAGLNPPGGVWQDTGFHNATLSLPNGSTEQVQHVAGQSVMSYMDPRGYTLFYLSNNFTLLTSMLVIQAVLLRCFFSSWIFNFIPIILTTISLITMSATYTHSLSFISSDDTRVVKSMIFYPSSILYSTIAVHFCRNVVFNKIPYIFCRRLYSTIAYPTIAVHFCRNVVFNKIPYIFCRRKRSAEPPPASPLA